MRCGAAHGVGDDKGHKQYHAGVVNDEAAVCFAERRREHGADGEAQHVERDGERGDGARRDVEFIDKLANARSENGWRKVATLRVC